jgi:hypothetical protein
MLVLNAINVNNQKTSYDLPAGFLPAVCWRQPKAAAV